MTTRPRTLAYAYSFSFSRQVQEESSDAVASAFPAAPDRVTPSTATQIPKTRS